MYPDYHGEFFRSCQKKLISAIERGMSCKKLEEFLFSLYSDQATSINTEDIHEVYIKTLEDRILKPRQDLYLFILLNWIRYIFLPSIDPLIKENLLIFGVGRIFSSYSNIGVQYCTDADINFVLSESVSAKDVRRFSCEVSKLKQTIWECFGIIVEVNTAFTVLRLCEIQKRLTHSDNQTRLATTLFYKGNSHSIFVIHDNQEIRTTIFNQVAVLPDTLIFENFLGANPAKPSYMRLKNNEAQLTIISDATLEPEVADSVIGCNSFVKTCRKLAGIHPDLFPQHWIFSMKYTINRAYDYVSAMAFTGYSLHELGFSGSSDPDYTFLCQAHRLMLYLQELIHIKLDSYTNRCDYSYLSAQRFAGFMDPPTGRFRKDFDAMVLSPNFLYASQRKRYREHVKAIHDKQELVISLTETQINYLSNSFDLKFRHLDKGSGKNPVAVPYTWEGLGFFVVSAVEDRLACIISSKLAPAVNATRRKNGT